MSHPDQFMIYHLVSWNAEKNKWNKKPVALDGSPLLEGQGIPTTADRARVVDTVNALNGDGQARYYMGLWLAPESGFFFLDLDDNAVEGGQLVGLAATMAEPFIRAGCYFEASTSGRGAHIIGRYHGSLPRFATSRKRVHPHEFYVRDRGCVLNPSAHAGDWNVNATALLLPLLAEHFPPRVETEELQAVADTPRPEWRGPSDDDELLRRALGATGSAAARFSGKARLVDLWEGRCQHDSESDMALASHLAFWTGCHTSRIDRLMRRSKLVRDKWSESRPGGTWLSSTISIACATTRTVYVEPQRVDTAAALLGTPRLAPPVAVQSLMPPDSAVLPQGGLISPAPVLTAPASPTVDWHGAVDQAIAAINNAGTFRELADVVIPSLGGYGFPRMHGERVVSALGAKLEIFNAKQPLSSLRALVMPPAVADALTLNVPEWAQTLVYLLRTDNFFDTATGTEYSHEAIKMEFNRHMPMKPTGTREDVICYLRDRWQIPTVENAEYRPDQPAMFEYAGRRYVNKFLASTMPTPVVGSPECVKCIELFQRHLLQLVNRRERLYWSLLHWIAHNVQRPGIKIRWSPLIKGVGGDGKSIIGDLLFAAMGAANVKITSPSTLSNSGGFTDWAHGACVNIIEEVRLEGKERRKLYNAMKTLIGDSRIDLNKKGKASGMTLVNVTNHAAFTNYQDAMPVDDADRRWLIMFAPWATADAAAFVKGFGSRDELPGFFRRLGESMRKEPGAWRAWLCGIDLSSFDADSRAPETDEHQAMASSSEDYVEQTVRDVINQGGIGVDKRAFCSASLMGRVQVLLGERPDSRSWNRILTDIGYQQLKPLWWSGKTRRIWAKSSMSADEAVEILNLSAVGNFHANL